ncbi:MAG: HlyD family secretion protein [Dyella sp.]
MNVQSLLRFLLTAVAVVVAAVLGHALWQHYMYSPWTRDGRIRAEVIRVAPDVSGLVSRLAVKDNQRVRKGDLLFTIDQARFTYAVAQAQANLAAAQASARAADANIDAAQAIALQRKTQYQMYAEQSDRRRRIGDVISQEDRNNASASSAAARASWEQAKAGANQAAATREQANAAVAQAQVALDSARLNLQRTDVRAPVDGYVTNLAVHVGDYATTGQARMALIDSHSYYIYGYFEETKLPYVQVGDPVDIRLMSGGEPLAGRVIGVARGITDADNPTGTDLLANVNPTFNWVRLAQRVPVRVAIDTAHLPAGLVLSAGMTATLVVHPVAHDRATSVPLAAR